MPRFFVSQEQIPVITGSDAHQIKNVLRLKVGDELELLDGSGKVYFAKISEIEKEKIVCQIIKTKEDKPSATVSVTIAQCLPKAKKMDLIIQKCTELGVDKIIPILSERSIAKSEKTVRWQKIAKGAAEQSGRSTIPEIAPLTRFNDLLKQKNEFDTAIVPWELEQELTLKSVLRNKPINKLIILVGPEGGFSNKEVELAKTAGFVPVTLGARILRTETAPMAILAMINYEFNQ